MKESFKKNVAKKAIPLTIFGCLMLPTTANAIDENLSNIVLSKEGGKDTLSTSNKEDKKPSLVSSRMSRMTLKNSFSDNSSSFIQPQKSEEKISTTSEYSVAEDIQLNKNSLKSKLIASEPTLQDTPGISIPVGQAQNQQEAQKPILIPSQLNGNDEIADSEDQLVLNKSENKSSKLDNSKSISIPVTPSSLVSESETDNSIDQSSLSTRYIDVDNYFERQTHTVKLGDTLNTISSRYGISTEELIKANNIKDMNLVKVDQTLIIPAKSSGLPQKPTLISLTGKSKRNTTKEITLSSTTADVDNIPVNLSTNKKTSSSTGRQVISAIPVKVEHYNPIAQPTPGEMVSPDLPKLYPPEQYFPNSTRPFKGYIWPAKGVLTSGYGWRWGRMHKGIDIAAPVGTPIVAISDAEVISAGWNSGGYGNLVKLKHFDGTISLYAHNSKLFVRRGQKVTQGQQIAAMGSTGFSTGPHLHFEIHPRSGKAVNPMAYLPKK